MRYSIEVISLVTLQLITVLQLSFAQCTPVKPKKPTLTGETGCEATLHWKAVPSITFYTVKFKEPNNPWQNVSLQLTDTFYTFKDLKLNIAYTFAVASNCSQTSSSAYLKKSQVNHPCSAPTSITATALNSTSVTISWTTCGPSNVNQIRYRKISTSPWNYVFTGSLTTAIVTVLNSGAIEYQATACIDTTGNWSVVNTFSFDNGSQFHQANAIVVLLDDSRFDTYSCNGAPTFFQTPAIDRIANEGVNFKNSFTVFSLCNPSRAGIFTGLYANHNGAVNNTKMFYDYLPTISTVLNSAGYYTAFMGKYMNANDDDPVPQPGWDWWMARIGSGHHNALFNYNGTAKKLTGHVTDVLTDSTVALINRVTQPFLIYVCYSATHSPYKPRAVDNGLFDNEEMPIPTNFKPYQMNYPNFLGTEDFFSHDSAGLTDDWRGYFEVMAGVDAGMEKILHALEAKGVLDSTLIIFTSDNGYLMGEHYLQGKRLPHDESMRIPMFIRYPLWFPAGSVIADKMTLNIDLAPTLFDLAGIPDTIQTDGISMHDLYDGSKDRTSFYYQATSLYGAPVNCRSVRSLHYKYTYYYCDELTEEFFDLFNDPAENTNLINDAAHQLLIQQYHDQLDSFKTALGDDIIEDISDCYLANPVNTRSYADEKSSESSSVFVYPNPASGTFQIELYSANADEAVGVTIYNTEGLPVFRLVEVNFSKSISIPINASLLKDGLYNILVCFKNKVISQKILIVR